MRDRSVVLRKDQPMRTAMIRCKTAATPHHSTLTTIATAHAVELLISGIAPKVCPNLTCLARQVGVVCRWEDRYTVAAQR